MSVHRSLVGKLVHHRRLKAARSVAREGLSVFRSPSIRARAIRETLTIPAVARRHLPRPPADGLVVEIGSGENPRARSDVVVDLFVSDLTERTGELALGKPFIVADGHRLPFRDGAFDYAIASHVLEHADDPETFAAEISRVARAGFVQTPSPVSELIFGWPFHRWEVEAGNGGLRFRPRREPISVGTFHRLYAEGGLFRLFFEAHQDLFFTSLEWRGRLPVQVDGEGAATVTASFDLAETLGALGNLARAGKVQPLPAPVLRTVVCPGCRGELQWSTDTVQCSSCGRQYPVGGGVPVLVLDEADPVDAAGLGDGP